MDSFGDVPMVFPSDHEDFKAERIRTLGLAVIEAAKKHESAQSNYAYCGCAVCMAVRNLKAAKEGK